eukprot:11171191-Alexandrium_andersonii.AAC.1
MFGISWVGAPTGLLSRLAYVGRLAPNPPWEVADPARPTGQMASLWLRLCQPSEPYLLPKRA